MMTVVTGGSKCGKSGYAEKILDGFTGKKIYIATMQPFGDEAFAAIARHHEMRKNRNFETIEKYTGIDEIQLPENCAVLLECMGNLCANEMFSDGELKNPAEKIISGIKKINNHSSKLVIVTNETGSDGIRYTPETMKYIEILGKINCTLAEIADNVIECVYGIPIAVKGEIYA